MSHQAMDCSSIRDAILAGSTPEGPGVSAHMRDCAACEELLRDSGTLGRALMHGETPAVSDDALLASLERAMRAESGPRAWIRSRPTWVRITLAALTAVAVVMFGGWASRDTARPVSSAWLVAFALAAFVCLRALVAPLGRPRRVPEARAALVVLGLALPLGYAALSVSHSPSSATLGFAGQAFACFAYGTFIAFPFLAVLYAIERSDRPWLVLLAGFGAISGLVANAALALHCPNTDPSHIAAGHATIGIALAALGALWALSSRRRA